MLFGEDLLPFLSAIRNLTLYQTERFSPLVFRVIDNTVEVVFGPYTQIISTEVRRWKVFQKQTVSGVGQYCHEKRHSSRV